MTIDITTARTVIAAVQFEETIELEWEGAPYMQTQHATKEGRAFYEAAHKGWPAALDRIEELERELARRRAITVEVRDALMGAISITQRAVCLRLAHDLNLACDEVDDPAATKGTP